MKRREKMNNEKKPFGEDKLGKLVRLMQKYQTELGMMEGDVQVQILSNGTGGVYAENELIYNFLNTQDMFDFLEAGQLKRTLMVRG